MRTLHVVKKLMSAAFVIPFAAGIFASAQQTTDFNDYHTLKSTGVMPAVIDKIRSQREESDRKTTQKDQDTRLEDNYRQASAYFVENLLLNGQVIFGDAITAYCNSIV
ncbi:MAG: hypothetical protein ACT6QS_17600, partial [Flavobacteriales bacterium]